MASWPDLLLCNQCQDFFRANSHHLNPSTEDSESDIQFLQFECCLCKTTEKWFKHVFTYLYHLMICISAQGASVESLMPRSHTLGFCKQKNWDDSFQPFSTHGAWAILWLLERTIAPAILFPRRKPKTTPGEEGYVVIMSPKELQHDQWHPDLILHQHQNPKCIVQQDIWYMIYMCSSRRCQLLSILCSHQACQPVISMNLIFCNAIVFKHILLDHPPKTSKLIDPTLPTKKLTNIFFKQKLEFCFFLHIIHFDPIISHWPLIFS